jgi:hypothetical protein
MERLQSLSFIAAPALFLAGWIVIVATREGAIRDWLLAHVLLFSGTVLLIPALFELRSVARSFGSDGTAETGMLLALAGLPFWCGQLAIDLAVGLVVPDRAAMGATFDRITSQPLMSLAFYTIGPALLWVGVGVLAVAVALSSAPFGWAGWVTALGVVLLGASRMGGPLELAVAAYLAMTIGLGAIGVASFLEPGGATSAGAG